MLHDQSVPKVTITETLHLTNPSCNFVPFRNANQEELSGLVARNAFQLVRCTTVPVATNIRNGRFILSIKGIDTPCPVYKARYVVQGHRDREKHRLVQNSSTARPASVHLLVTIFAMRGYVLRSFDVTKVYLQSNTYLSRAVYVRPPRELTDPDVHLLLLKKELYELSDSGDYWHHSVDKVLRYDVKLEPSTEDPALYYVAHHHASRSSGMVVTKFYVVRGAVTVAFNNRTLSLQGKFDSNPRESTPTFSGVRVTPIPPNAYLLHEATSATQLRTLSADATFEEYRSVRPQLSWIGQIRPDLVPLASISCQVTPVTISKGTIKLINDAVRHAHAVPDRGLVTYPLQ